jgi:preprotein translocase subunit SecD
MANTHDHAQLVGKARASNAREVMTTGGDGVAKVAARWVGVADFEQESVRSFPQLVSRELADRDLEVLIIQDDLNLDGSYVTSAQAISDSNGNPSVVFALNATGAQMLGEITIANLPDPVRGIKRQLGLILDGHLITAPSINSVIYERVEITGSFTAQETERIAAILLAGPFPAPLKLVSEAAAMP